MARMAGNCPGLGWYIIPFGKGPETNRNEATHEVLRRKLNRLARRTQGYSKSLAMLVDSLALVWLKPGWIHNACPCREYRILCLIRTVLAVNNRSNQI